MLDAVMKWDVEYTNEFESWWESLSESEQDDVVATVNLLGEKGPSLSFPFSSGISGSKHSHMRELRVQHAGDPYRVLYAFDPRRCAILLIGGNKVGNNRWYDEFIPQADKIYNNHLDELKKEDLL
jgi:hypothetical protein